MKELWLPVVGFEGLYEVSNLARVKSLDRYVRHPRGGSKFIKGQLLIPSGCGWKRRYRFITLRREGIKKAFYVHRLVLEAFVGPCPEGMEALHGPAGYEDCSLSNLSWGTKKANMLDKHRDGTTLHGSRNHQAKLTTEQVLDIRDRCASGQLQKEVAALYNLNTKYIGQLVRRESWKHV